MSAIANASIILDRVRDLRREMGDIAAMADETWRDRLEEAIARSGKSDRAISRAIGRAPGYVHGILKEGKEPGVESMIRLAAEVDTSVIKLFFGADMSADTEKLLRLYASLSDDQKADFLKLAESVAGLAGRSEQ